jgi:hypothetical protein
MLWAGFNGIAELGQRLSMASKSGAVSNSGARVCTLEETWPVGRGSSGPA